MRVRRFEVEGFKNIRQRVSLQDLGPLNVIYGENNVGKSNLLQSIALFFRLMDDSFGEIPPTRRRELKPQVPQALGLEASRIFDLLTGGAIRMHAQITFDEGETIPLDYVSSETVSEVEVAVVIEPAGSGGRYFFERVLVNRTWDPLPQGLVREVYEVFHFLSRVMVPRSDQVFHRFAFIDISRRTLPLTEVDRSSHEIIPPSRLLELFDARESTEPLLYQRWQLFVETLARFSDVMGFGQPMVLFDRHTGTARLVLQTERARIPFDLMGSGVQQVVALVAQLILTNAIFVAIEEPELNLRYALQGRLREMLEALVSHPAGPRQIFLSSHSNAFESGDAHYLMSMTPRGPTVERRLHDRTERYGNSVVTTVSSQPPPAAHSTSTPPAMPSMRARSQTLPDVTAGQFFGEATTPRRKT